MSNQNQMEVAHRKEQTVLRALFDSLNPPGQKTVDFSMERMYNEKGIPQHVGAKAMPIFQQLGIVEKFGPYFGGKKSGLAQGRHFDYTLKTNFEDALELLVEDQAKRIQHNIEAGKAAGRKAAETRRKNAAKRALETIREDETVYVSGDAAETIGDRMPVQVHEQVREPFRDEPAALVEATRQYLKQRQTVPVSLPVDESIATLEAEAKRMGLEFDRQAFVSLFPDFVKEEAVERDELFEAIALVLPYIDKLEETIAILRSMYGRSTNASTINDVTYTISPH